MRFALRCRVTAGVLLVLWATAQCDAVPEETSAGEDSSLSSILDQLWAFIGGAVKSVTQSVVSELDGRLADVETRLVTQVSALSSQLDGVTAELKAQNTELSAQNTELSAQNTELSAQNTELSAQNSQLASRLDGVQTELSTIQAGLSGPAPPRDCSDLPAGARSGVHLVYPGLGRSVAAYCDLDTDGGNWTVFQRRDDILPRRDFFLGWQAYKWGLGELDAEFWWGLEHLWLTTCQLDRQYELRVDLEDFDGEKRHAVYQGFRISSEEDGYRLTAVNYTGDAGDSLTGHSGTRFSTKDRDHDTNSGGSCAESYKGAWWYTKCHNSNLNGLYLAGKHDSYANGVDWQAWKGYHYSLKTVTMKIRPTKKL